MKIRYILLRVKDHLMACSGHISYMSQFVLNSNLKMGQISVWYDSLPNVPISVWQNLGFGPDPSPFFGRISLNPVFKRQVVTSIPHCVCLSVSLSKKSKIPIMSIAWLRLNCLSIRLSQTIIDNLLAGTVLIENHLHHLIQQKYKKI